jgi:acyl-CoA reductase-like NAD-dependent aldehyde dehydrogenase
MASREKGIAQRSASTKSSCTEQGVRTATGATPARDAFAQAADRVRSDGGQVLQSGRAPDRAGLFVEPTVVTGIPPDHPVEVIGMARPRISEEAGT